jgi:hypothetical protein
MLVFTLNLAGGGFASPNLKYNFNNGTDGVLLAAGDTPSAGDTAFSGVTTNTGSGGVYAYENAFPAHGALGLKVQTVATSVSCFAEWNITGSGLALYSRYYIYIPTGTTLAARWDHWQPRDTATRIRHGLSTSFQMVAVNGSTVVATSTNTLPFDTQIRVEGKLIIDAAAGIIEVKFFTGDSTTPIETITATGLNTGTVECTNLRMGNPFATANLGPIYMDDFAVSYTGYMGPASAATDYSETKTDSAGLSDSLVPVVGYDRTQTDVTGLVDAIVAALAYDRTLTDTSGLTDSVTALVAKLITVDDSAGLVDAIGTIVAYARSQTDTTGLTDAIVSALAFARTIDDGTGLTDNIVTLLAKLVNADDSAGLTDAIASEMSFFRNLDDVTGLTDELIVNVTETFYRFTPPSRRRRPELERPHGLWLRIGQETGISVLKFGASYQQLEDPDPVDITAADIAYLGGRSYRINGAEAGALTTAGYGSFIVAE